MSQVSSGEKTQDSTLETRHSHLRLFWLLPRKLAVYLVGWYQKTISPDHSPFMRRIFPGGHCKYTPTCSEYSRLVYHKRGFVVGTLKTLWRILRCNPWSNGGMDLP